MATLSAQGRSTAVAVSFFVGAWCVCVPLAWVLGFEIHPFSDNNGLLGLWIAMAVGCELLALHCSFVMSNPIAHIHFNCSLFSPNADLITTFMSLYFVCVSDWEQVLEDARKRNETGAEAPENDDNIEKGAFYGATN